MRVSSLMRPASSNGTFRSARMNTRLPDRAPDLASADRVLTLGMSMDSYDWRTKGTNPFSATRGKQIRPLWPDSVAYLADISAMVVSSMRFEKPHSLSYQDETLTRRPETLVSDASTVLEAGLWL